MSQGRLNKPENVWDHVKRGAPDECWPWTASLGRHGYGLWSLDGRTVRAHRVAFEVANGIAAGELLVCHSCDNRACCNPAHVFLGTGLDNIRDAKDKGRLVKVIGSRHGISKLTESQVLEIRRRHAAGENRNDLARAFGISKGNVNVITSGRGWRHVEMVA